MESFKKFLVTEKVSETEYKEARKDQNLQLGLEFEVVDAEFVGSGSGEDIESIAEDYERFIREILDFANSLVEKRHQWWLEIRDELDSEIHDLNTELDDLEDKMRETNDELEPERYEELQSKWEELDDKRQELNNMDVDEYADENSLGYWLDDVSRPWFNSGEYERWVEDFGYDFPDNDKILQGCLDTTDYGMSRISYNTVAENILRGLPDPHFFEDEDSEEFDEDHQAFKDLVKTVMKGKSPKVGGYHNSSDYTSWRVESDTSLDDGGAEIISPVLSLDDGIDAIENMFKWIDRYANTNTSTGFHVNMSFKNYDMKNFDWFKLLFFVEEGAIYKNFSDRRGNGYANSITKYFTGPDFSLNDIGSKEYFKTLAQVQSDGVDQIKKKIQAGKFFGVNFLSIINGSNGARVEFRYLGGRYHRKKNEVLKNILRFAVWMKIALDPNYKRKEYLKKLTKLIQENLPEYQNAVKLFDGWDDSSKPVVVKFDPDTKKIVFFQYEHKVKEMTVRQALKDSWFLLMYYSEGYTKKSLMMGKPKASNQDKKAWLKAVKNRGSSDEQSLIDLALNYK